MRQISISTCGWMFFLRRTTKIKPRSFAVVHFNVYFSFLYGGFLEALLSSPVLFPDGTFSSIKTSLISALIMFELTGTYDFEYNTTPEVVRISNESSMLSALDVNDYRKVVFSRGIYRGSWQLHNDTYSGEARIAEPFLTIPADSRVDLGKASTSTFDKQKPVQTSLETRTTSPLNPPECSDQTTASRLLTHHPFTTQCRNTSRPSHNYAPLHHQHLRNHKAGMAMPLRQPNRAAWATIT